MKTYSMINLSFSKILQNTTGCGQTLINLRNHLVHSAIRKIKEKIAKRLISYTKLKEKTKRRINHSTSYTMKAVESSWCPDK